jgi:hypothetical protein
MTVQKLWYSVYINPFTVRCVCYQSWVLAHFFEVRCPLPTQFFPLDR